MLGKTHRAGGVAFMMVGFEYMRMKGMLTPEIHPLLQLSIMYPVSQWASTLPDLDHHWESVGAKTPVNKIVHFLLHLTRPKHRSWQTHSLLVTGGFIFLLHTLILYWEQVFGFAAFNSIEGLIIRMLLVGFELGLASHLALDALNPKGIHLYPGFKIRLVPKTSFFATGGPWETFMFYLCNIISALAAINLLLSFFDHTLFSLWDLIVSWVTSRFGF